MVKCRWQTSSIYQMSIVYKQCNLISGGRSLKFTSKGIVRIHFSGSSICNGVLIAKRSISLSFVKAGWLCLKSLLSFFRLYLPLHLKAFQLNRPQKVTGQRTSLFYRYIGASNGLLLAKDSTASFGTTKSSHTKRTFTECLLVMGHF